MLPKALIFDVDGTLAETEELHRQAFNESFIYAGIPWSWDRALYARLLETTGGKERIRRYIDQDGARPALDDETIREVHASKTTIYGKLVSGWASCVAPWRRRPPERVSEAGVRLAVATTTSRSNVDALLAATLGYQPFEVIAAGDEVAEKKPAPDIYTVALDRLGLSAKRCIAFEDTLNGLSSATQAGLPTS